MALLRRPQSACCRALVFVVSGDTDTSWRHTCGPHRGRAVLHEVEQDRLRSECVVRTLETRVPEPLKSTSNLGELALPGRGAGLGTTDRPAGPDAEGFGRGAAARS